MMEMKREDRKTFFFQFVKFGLVGVSNTLITAGVIALLLEVFLLSDLQANLVGYAAGLVNSFVWNRRWTFRSKSKIKDTVLKFMLIFVVSYVVQWGVVSLLLRISNVEPYVCHLLGMVVYTVFNFLLNKFYTFKNG